MPLPLDERAFLDERGLQPIVIDEAGFTCLVFPQWPLPPGFTTSVSDLLVRLPAGFPDLAPDMWWFDPPVTRADGAAIPQTQVHETHLGRGWQRWSRHFAAGQWQAGVDSLETYLALIGRELRASAS